MYLTVLKAKCEVILGLLVLGVVVLNYVNWNDMPILNFP